MSESGKRLRVERDGVGRAGGVFVNGIVEGRRTDLSPRKGDGGIQSPPLELGSVASHTTMVVREEPPAKGIVAQVA